MKMAVDFQSGLCITASTRLVTYLWPSWTLAGGCSLFFWLGTTHDTAGSVPLLAAARNAVVGWMLPSSWAWRTVSNQGSGFHMPGVRGACLGGVHAIASSSQSGWIPPFT